MARGVTELFLGIENILMVPSIILGSLTLMPPILETKLYQQRFYPRSLIFIHILNIASFSFYPHHQCYQNKYG